MNLETLAPFTPKNMHVPEASSSKFSVCWASCEQDVREAQRLRYLVFAEEMGARLHPPEGTPHRQHFLRH